jgi:hypothetical protein
VCLETSRCKARSAARVAASGRDDAKAMTILR